MKDKPLSNAEATQKIAERDAVLKSKLEAALRGEYPTTHEHKADNIDSKFYQLTTKRNNKPGDDTISDEPDITAQEPDTTFSLSRLINEPLNVLGELGCIVFALVPFAMAGWWLLMGMHQFFLVDEHRRIYVDDSGEPTQAILEWYQGRTFWEQQKIIVTAELQEEMADPDYSWLEYEEYPDEYSDDEVGRLRRRADKLEWEKFSKNYRQDMEKDRQAEIERLSSLLKKVEDRLNSPTYRISNFTQ